VVGRLALGDGAGRPTSSFCGFAECGSVPAARIRANPARKSTTRCNDLKPRSARTCSARAFSDSRRTELTPRPPISAPLAMDPVRKQGVARFPGFPLRVPRERQGEGDGGSPGPVQTGESRVKARYANSKRICVHYGRRRVKSSHFPSRPLSRGPLPPPIRPPPPTLPDVEGRHPRSNLRRSFRRARVPSSLLIYGGACRTGFRNSDVVESARSRYASCVTRPNANGKCGTSSFPIAG